MSFHLVNTPLSKGSTNLPIVFSGPWAINNYLSSNLHDALIPKYHWSNEEKFEADYLYLSDFIRKLLLSLSEALDSFHNEKNHSKHWEILLMPWLNNFIPAIFDRWETIQTCIDNYQISSASIIDSLTENFVPNSTQDFLSNFIAEDSWNEYIFSKIIINYFDFELIKSNEHSIKQGAKSKRSSFKDLALTSLYQIINKLIGFKKRDVLLYNCFSGLEQLKLSITNKDVLPGITFKKFPVFQYDYKSRKEIQLKMDPKNNFEDFCIKIISENLPKVFVEGYSFLVGETFNAITNYPKYILTCSSIYSDEQFKHFTAYCMQKFQTKLIVLQHGGHYGIGKLSNMLEHEESISDHFISWGWKTSKKILPSKAWKLNFDSAKIKSKKKGNLLISIQDMPKYSYHLFSSPFSSNYIDYIKEISSFIEGLPISIQSQAITRVKHTGRYGWDQKNYFQAKHTNITFDDCSKSYGYMVSNASLIIETANFTTLLSSLASNTPTVVFFDERFFRLSSYSKDDFLRLKEVNIFFDCAKDAATHVKNIWLNIDDWWQDPMVQNARIKFLKKYVDISPSPFRDFKKLLASIKK